jgi:hypothetical protein
LAHVLIAEFGAGFLVQTDPAQTAGRSAGWPAGNVRMRDGRCRFRPADAADIRQALPGRRLMGSAADASLAAVWAACASNSQARP